MKKLYALLALLVLSAPLLAQDPNQSLPFSTPVLVNPAFAGLTDGVARINVSHRLRRATEDINYNTTQFSGDYALRFPAFKGGVNVFATTDYAAGLRTNNYFASLSYEAPLGVKVRYHHLRAGFTVGMVQRTLDNQNFTFEDQFTGTGFYGPSSEQYNNMTVLAPEVSVGVLWYRTQKIKGNPEFNHFLGYSAHHITQPKIGFFSQNGANEKLSIRHSIIAGGKIRTRIPLDVNIWALMMIQNNQFQATVGTYVRYVLYEKGFWFGAEKVAISAGVNFKTATPMEAFTVLVGLEVKRMFHFGFAYDILLSNTQIVNTNGFGGFQINASYTFGTRKYNLPALPFPNF